MKHYTLTQVQLRSIIKDAFWSGFQAAQAAKVEDAWKESMIRKELDYHGLLVAWRSLQRKWAMIEKPAPSAPKEPSLEAGRGRSPQLIDVDDMRRNLHTTFNGGWHHSEDGMTAYHHGMDTVCNVLAAYQKGESTNGIFPSPPKEPQ